MVHKAMKKLFGTDGVRGTANHHPVTCEMICNLGRATARFFEKESHPRRIVVGKDTRNSGDMLECAVAAGVCSAGWDAALAGVLPTPGIAFVTRTLNAGAGIVISASHNPYADNGLKVFDARGYKLPDSSELSIEALVSDQRRVVPERCGTVAHLPDAAPRYIEFLKGTFPKDLKLGGVDVVLDCSHGATFSVAPATLTELGAAVTPLFVSPDGTNINEGCGSQHTETLRREVLQRGAQAGFAFDGDGDRVIAVDECGKALSGDQMLAICARHMKRRGTLWNNTVVSTVMSNLGLKIFLKELGVRHIATQVGDRYVLDAMRSGGAALGGEDSGHMIFLSHHTTGDGMVSALQLLRIMLLEQRPLSELARRMEVFPQVLLNVEVLRKPDIDSVPALVEAIREVEAALGDHGRVLVRYSGTRSVCRVMVEGPTPDTTRRLAEQIAQVALRELGRHD